MRSSTSVLIIALVLALAMYLPAQTIGSRSNQFDPDAKRRSPANMASPYVPLDSWVYSTLDRLEALGFVQIGFLGIRPWTRMECARLVVEAEERTADIEPNSE